MFSEIINVKVVEGEDWDFRGVDTRYMTHGLHPYPARMIPQVAGRLLRRYASRGDVVLDPFCGSGGVLVEARLAGMHSVGVDINPLACLLAEVKSNPLSPDVIWSYWSKLKVAMGNDVRAFKFREIKSVELPDFSGTNIEYWFKPATMMELAIIRKHLEDVEDERVRKFFDVCFSLTVREVSGTRKGEFKLYRMPKEEWEKYFPDVFGVFVKHVEDAARKMGEFYNACDKSVFSRVFMADTRDMLTERFPRDANELLLSMPPKIIVTSPPYGDSRTTVAYGQFSRLSSLWLNFEKGFDKKTIMKVDEMSLGGRLGEISKLDLPTLNMTLEAISKSDGRRAMECASFFLDLYKCLENMYRCLKEDGYCCIVVANRTMKRVQVPTHIIIAEMGVQVGFKNDVTIIPRTIPSKRLPWENAPENIPGLKGKTMSKENIIIMKK
ncbi:MAG: DNA methyltransferase [Candidatus Jordarchaeales archaeon]|nr:DNA methyltransferase [Candidatus Jordarchaeia archaeon]